STRGSTRPGPSSDSSSRRSGSGVPAASSSGTRSAAGSAGGASEVVTALKERHPGRHVDLDECGGAGGEAIVERLAQVVASADTPGADAVGLRDGGGLERRQIEPRGAGHLLDVGEPLEDPVLLV